MPTRCATSAAVRASSPVMTMIRSPASWHRRTASATSGRGGSSRPTTPSRHRSCSASARSSGQRPGGRSRRATASTRRPRRVRSATVASTSARAPASQGRGYAVAQHRRAAREHRLRGALDVQPHRRRRVRRPGHPVHGRGEPERRAERVDVQLLARRRGVLAAQQVGGLEQRQLGGVGGGAPDGGGDRAGGHRVGEGEDRRGPSVPGRAARPAPRGTRRRRGAPRPGTSRSGSACPSCRCTRPSSSPASGPRRAA